MILDKRADLGHGDVKKLLFSLSVPTITSQIVNMLYNLVDRVFIGHMQPAETVGKLALTGVGVCLPIIMIISAFASLMAIGGAPRASIADGAGESERSERIMGNCLTMLLITSLVLTILFEVFAERLLLLFGASENTVGYALDYMRIYALGTVFVQLTLGMNAYITAQGFTTVSMKTVLLGALLNTALDPVFIFMLHLGIKGAAIATVISQILGAVFVLWFLLKKAEKKAERWQTIALGAAKQSKRMQIPTVHMPVTFQQALAMMAESDVRLMPYENAEGMEGTRRILESIEPGESIAVLIGPEGGIDEAEVEMAMKAKVEPITLGKRILRTETAGMTVLSILVYLLEGRERTR